MSDTGTNDSNESKDSTRTPKSGRKLRAVGAKQKSGKGARKHAGVGIPRHFTRVGEDPFDAVEWELRNARIANEQGDVVFEQEDCEISEKFVSRGYSHYAIKYNRFMGVISDYFTAED